MKSLCFLLRRPDNCEFAPAVDALAHMAGTALTYIICCGIQAAMRCRQFVFGASAYSSPTGALPNHTVDDLPQNLTIPSGSALRTVQSNKVYLPPTWTRVKRVWAGRQINAIR